MHLGDRVLRPASRPEPIGARLKVDLEDRLQHQLHRRLHDPIADRCDPEPAELPATLGDHPLPDRQQPVAPCPQLLTELRQELLHAQPLFDVVGGIAVHASRARPTVRSDQKPRDLQRDRVTDEVVEVLEPPVLIILSPLVELALDPEYPRLSHHRLQQRSVAIQRRPFRIPATAQSLLPPFAM
jgi:hypothetical protein